VNSARFYKFRGVGDDLAKDYALHALFNSYAIFSGRKNFNDLFDSKIDIPRPTPEQILALARDPGVGANAAIVHRWISDGAFTFDGLRALSRTEAALNELFDSYPIYSLSSHNNCPLLWAHYASCHAGFCIELEFPGNQPKQVDYRKQIDSIPLVDFIKVRFGLIGSDFGARIHDALLVKLDCWAYEGEYRWIATNEMGRVPRGDKFIKIPYDPEWVKAIIFGCRMRPEVKTYIRKNLPFSTEFKQAMERKDRIEVVAFDELSHL